MKSIAIFTEECSLFASSYLAEAIGAELYVMIPEYNIFFGEEVNGKLWMGGDAIKEDNLIVIGAVALKNISQKIKDNAFSSVAVILSDSVFCRDHKWVNDFVEQYNITVYAMPDITPFCNKTPIPVYQAMKIRQEAEEKPQDRLLISHSPNNPIKAITKGTPFIQKTLDKLKRIYDFDYDIIMGSTMKDCIRRKSRSHIFIDQMIYGNDDVPQKRWGEEIKYHGGLGKSGIEAILLGCCVITGGEKPNTGPFFPPPPVVWSSYDTFYSDLKELIVYKKLRDHKTLTQSRWAERYLSFEFISKHITQHIQ